MPSWNIHTALAERVLDEEGPERLGIRDVDAFLLGNLAPDVHVGYMVAPKRLSRKLKYRFTHFTPPSIVPEPAYWKFFERYGDQAEGPAGDMVLGCWAHLVADHTYNVRSNRFLWDNGIEPCDAVRKRKQGDFDVYGCQAVASRAPHATAGVIAQATAFPQYAFTEGDVVAACESMEGIVAKDAARRAEGLPGYQMFDQAFLDEAFAAAGRIIAQGLLAYAQGDPYWGERRDEGSRP